LPTPKEKVELASRRVIDTLDRMSEIFLPGDPLLRSAGVFPVYYWFVRENTGSNDQYIREFLNFFEKTRKENRERASEPVTASTADSELLTFDRLNRSTDDERSHLERYRILAKRFKEYSKTIRRPHLFLTTRTSRAAEKTPLGGDLAITYPTARRN
jgi:hypothetical protein